MSQDVILLHIKRSIEKNTECFLCSLEDEIERRYIDTYLSELVMDASSREKIVESRGFCNSHSYKMLIAASKPESPDGHGMALTMKSVIEQLIQDLHQLRSGHRGNFHGAFIDGGRCPACVHLADFMGPYVKSVAQLLASNDKEFLRLFKESKGLCVPHFSILTHVVEDVTQNRSRGIIEAVTEVQERSLGRLILELSEYVRRQSYEFSHKDRAVVEDVVLRSVEKTVGRRGVKLG